MNLWQKIIEIRKQIDNFTKDTKGYGYSYVSGSQVLSKIRPTMDALGLILKSWQAPTDSDDPDQKDTRGNVRRTYNSNPVEKTYKCQKCGKAVTEKIAKYAYGKFNRVLCMDCQQSMKGSAN